MNELLTVALGVGLFYLFLNPDKVCRPKMLVQSVISYCVSVLVTLLVILNDDGPKLGFAVNVLATVASLACLFAAISPLAGSKVEVRE